MGTCWARGLALAGALVCAAPHGARSAEAVNEETLNVDLAPLIDAATAKRERFAVSLPHVHSIEDVGSWMREAGVSTWHYTVRIPTAVSMSFHADRYNLPSGAVLQVNGADGSKAVYSPSDGGTLGLWSRIQRGDALHFELRVPTGAESQVEFRLASLQAGYRGLGWGAPDHPHFRGLRRMRATEAAAAACIESFACHETTENSHNGDATAAIVIGGVALCTATLINNLRNDGTPYLLSARHCQDTPQSGVVVYWDAVTPCGALMGSVYDTETAAYLHNTDTVFEQQDVWLIRLSSPLSARRVYFAGWDVTGGTFVGGYSPHHAMGRSRQYAEWFGQAFPITLEGSVLGVGYDSNYWGVVNSVGSVGSGASGGGLFNMDHRLVGVASLAYLQDGPGSDGVCPATSPRAPDAVTSTALYNSLSAVWESNADTTSSTNPITLQSLLDPDNTGNRIVNGFESLPGMYLSSNQSYSDTGRAITLTWSGGAATSCMASDGVPGDGWSGPRALNGTAEITQYDAGLTTYTIRCTDGVRFAIRSVRVLWNLAPPSLLFAPSDSSGYLGTTVRMFWRGTALPCVASGGVAGDGWAGSRSPTGTLDVPLLRTGDTSYTMTCGTGPRAATQTMQVTAFAPIATLSPVTTSIRVNSELLVMQSAGGVSCTRSGGAPDDGWTSVTGSFPLRLRSAVPGTYGYTLTCYGGPNGSPASAQATMDITFTNDAPAATLTASQPSAEVIQGIPIDAPRYAIEFTWQSNVAPCQLTYDGPGDNDGEIHPDMDFPATGRLKSWQFVPGIYVYTETCRSGTDLATATATVEFTPTRPTVTVFRDQTIDLARDQGFTLYWSSNAAPCVATGGSPGDGWAGPQSTTNGQPVISVAQVGTYVYTMTCGSGPDAVSDSITITIPPAALVFEPHATQMLASRGLELRWRGTVGNCVQTGDWSSSVSPRFANGSDIVSSSTPGTRTYGIRCGITDFLEATTQVTWLPVPIVDITASVASTGVNESVTLTWTSTDADGCTAQGVTGVPQWNGSLPTSGSRVVTRSTPGAVGFYINCGDVVDAVVVEWRPITSSPPTPSPPTVTLTIDPPTRVVGEAVTLRWTTTHAAACRGLQGVSGDGWVGALPVSGTRTIAVFTAGTYAWEIACDGAPPAAIATVSATFTPSSGGGGGGGGGGSGDGGSGGGGGGGGSLDPRLLTLLGIMILVRLRVGRSSRSARATGDITKLAGAAI